MQGVPISYIDRYFLIGAFVLLSLVAWAAWNIYNINKLENIELETAARFKEIRSYEENVYLPDVKVAGPAGDLVNITDSGGRFTVFNIWATWCSPCVKELASLNLLDQSFKKDKNWRVMAVSIDQRDNLLRVAQFTTRYQVEKIANYHDYNSDFQKAFNVQKLPTTLIVSPSGRILYEIRGDAIWHDQSVIRFLKQIEKVHKYRFF